MIKVLVRVETPDGPRYEWREVEGYEIPLGVELRDGDSLMVEWTVAADSARDAG